MSLRSIDPAALLLLHQESQEGNPDDFDPCDEMLLDAALAYPPNQAILRAADVADIAAAYAIGILKFRPFAVGNERAAFLAMGLFLYLNDWRLNAPQEEAARIMWRASAAEMDESELADWIRSNL
jgi:death on curing protein